MIPKIKVTQLDIDSVPAWFNMDPTLLPLEARRFFANRNKVELLGNMIAVLGMPFYGSVLLPKKEKPNNVEPLFSYYLKINEDPVIINIECERSSVLNIKLLSLDPSIPTRMINRTRFARKVFFARLIRRLKRSEAIKYFDDNHRLVAEGRLREVTML